MISRAILSCLLIGLTSGTVLSQVDANMFRYPDVSNDLISFVYAGDIWVVDKRGGAAKRLSSPRGEEQFPRFSPDGTRIAFSANYDGNLDLYVTPSQGGEAVRVTHHPGADRMIEWAPDGKRIMFASRRKSGIRSVNQLFLVSPEGGLPTKLPPPYGEFGALSPNGKQLAFTTKSRGFRTWKRYRGGLAPEIWLFDLESNDARNLSNSDANDSQPMWHGKKIYFLSDRGSNQRSNIWSYDLGSKKLRQVTRFEEFDITWPAIGPREIVFQAGGKLYLMDLGNERYKQVDVEVVTDLATLRPQSKNVSRLIRSAHISPTGKRAVFEARGEIFTVPAEHGVVRRLTSSSGAADRSPNWSPDGQWIAYWSDESGEYELTLAAADGSEEPETLTKLGPGFRYRPRWSPDSKKLAFIDHAQKIRIFEIEGKSLTEVGRGRSMLHGQLRGFHLDWSSDSDWIAYSRSLETGNGAVFLFDVSEGVRHQVTSGYYSDSNPVFDPDGKYLYFLSDRTFRPIYSDLDATWVYPNTTNLVAASLRKDVPSPLAPRNDEEPVKEDKGEEEEDEKKPAADKEEEPGEESGKPEGKEKPKGLSIDLDGFESRIVILPPEAGNYGDLTAVKGKVVFQRNPRSGSRNRKSLVGFYDLKGREEKTIIEDVGGYEISADGKSMLVRQNRRWGIVKVAPKQKIKKPLATDKLETIVDPRQEWRHLFTEVWRTYRDYFYDPSMHGLDWNGLRKQYGDLLEDAVTRWDVNFVIGELIGEVNASHTYVGGGDTERPANKQVGLLGVDWALENGAYKIDRIVRGAEWDVGVRSPLAEPGIDVNEGDYILAVNGVPIEAGKDPYAAFQGLANQTALLTVNDRPSREGARQVLVKTLSSEARLRNLEWIESNRRRVDKASNGRVGYVYVPNTAVSGQTELIRQFNSQMRREGLIIDERFNGGGQLPDRFIELMNRQMVTRIAFRNGATATHPQVTHYGAKVMLINGWAGSGGDAFPFFFREMKVGPIIGERTWGGLIGPAVGHRLIDGGFYTAPPGRLYGVNGVWFAEGHGVDPDIHVVDHPGEMARGKDPQLETAIQEVLRLIQGGLPEFADPPAFETRIPQSGGK